ncbi:hypothetical protein RQM47_01225 [Rubrivirga sp. S365]|uniref:Lipoprotein n=1 Tax=Rubrivirga litoralis TaxID=3075598 RepID=A0ABU3BS73_9BACT|nr:MULTISPECIES: hypothetical protein [unclassified Rubrivirga]MDT0632046.1 hypothetical protein [Rubrivirga sp. F394]MDT7855257.1 hypothetical protein [Rubrivirga sp. S365]
MTRPLALPALAALAALAACTDAPPEGAAATAPPPGAVEVVSNESDAAETPARPAPAAVDTTLPPTVTVAGQTVPRRAFVEDVEAGERVCHLTLRTDGGGVEQVMGDFSLCEGQAIQGERVQIEYATDVVPAASCVGDPDCLETETVPFAVVVDVIGRR